ncbi:hypothetical protein HF325_001410 [Metschnikowia pulcherrima]|uniref:Uncharacterized protein n=1 Tax=Metschnikowia pulcherrima TaxID=27326 RepID=A0A8H7GW15_9ASCO|nr:hypothetical protein HF325_001410 [Metschnikowia pulcherrima]
MCDVLCDNKPTIQSVLNTISDLGTRHVRKFSDFVEQQAKLQKMTLSYVNMNNNSADMFTKQIPQEPFKKKLSKHKFSRKSFQKPPFFLMKKGSLLVHRRIHGKKRLEPYKTIWNGHWWTKLEHQNSQL